MNIQLIKPSYIGNIGLLIVTIANRSVVLAEYTIMAVIKLLLILNQTIAVKMEGLACKTNPSAFKPLTQPEAKWGVICTILGVKCESSSPVQ